MSVIKNYDHSNFFGTMDTMDITISQIKAMSVMLEFTLRSGEDVSEISSGVEQILLQQCDDLTHLRDTISDQYNHLKLNKLVIKDVETTAKWAGTSPKMAAAVINVATGIKLPLLNEEAYQELVENAQQISIMIAMQSKTDLEHIAKKAGVTEATVARVLDEALLYKPSRETVLNEQDEQNIESHPLQNFNEVFVYKPVTTMAEA